MGHTTNEIKSNQTRGYLGSLVPDNKEINLVKQREDVVSMMIKAIKNMNTDRQEQHLIIDQLELCTKDRHSLHKKLDDKTDQMIRDIKK